MKESLFISHLATFHVVIMAICNRPLKSEERAVFCAFLCAGQSYDSRVLAPFFGLEKVCENTYR